MVRLAHDSGGAVDLKCRQVLGDDSPLAFDDDGYAWVDDDDVAERIAALHTHVTVEPAAPAPDADDEDDGAGMGYEERIAMAEGLANMSWQHAVATIENGDADEYLDELEGADDRDSVLEAIAERRDAETDTE